VSTAPVLAPREERGVSARRPSGVRWHALALGSALASLLYLMWPTFRIQFGPIDDHEIVDIIGRHDRLPTASVIPTILDRANEPGGRFRPLYWVGRTLESATAGTDPTWWYVDRFLLAAVTLTAVYLTVARFIHPAAAAAISLLPFVGAPFETWGRLGPSEAYAMPLLCVGAALIIRGLASGHPPRRLWAGYLLLVLAGLAKENFVLASLAVTCWSVWHVGARRLTRADWLTVGTALLAGLLDVLMAALKLSRYGTVYPQQRTAATVRGWGGFAYHALDGSALVTVGAVCAVVLFLVAGRNRLSWSRALQSTVATVAIVAMQVVFYAGGPTEGRYLYPSALAAVVVWSLVAVLAASVRRPGVQRLLLVPLVALLLVPIARGIHTSRESAAVAARVTQAYQAKLESIERRAAESGVQVVVVQPGEPTELERVLAVARYLTVRTDLQVMTLQATGPSVPAYAGLARQLGTWSTYGFDALSPYSRPDQCLSIMFGAKDRPICPFSARSPG
jgi:hypothetical protein